MEGNHSPVHGGNEMSYRLTEVSVKKMIDEGIESITVEIYEHFCGFKTQNKNRYEVHKLYSKECIEYQEEMKRMKEMEYERLMEDK